jgi:PKHD-type hydroxylase
VGAGIFERAAAFTTEECAALIGVADALGGEAAPVYGSAGAQVNVALRSATTVVLTRQFEHEWVFARLDDLFASAAQLWAIQVERVLESVQLVRYGPGDHFQMWHSDAGGDRGEARLVSASIELSWPADYEGGRLEIAPWRMLPQHAPPQGQATLFPSRCLHRVTPVERGVRYALVAWTGLNPA